MFVTTIGINVGYMTTKITITKVKLVLILDFKWTKSQKTLEKIKNK